jgi:hypothetical protein
MQSELFAQTEKAVLWDLLESRRISIGPIGFEVADGFCATAWIERDDDVIDTFDAKGGTAKEAVEKLMHEMEGAK